MPGQLKHKLIVICVFGCLAGASAVALNTGHKPDETQIKRGLASVPAASPFIAGKVFGKHLAPIQVAVRAPAGIAVRDADETELVGWVRLNQPIQGQIEYSWNLPEGVQVIEGSAQSFLDEMPVGETKEVRLVVRGFSGEELRLITLQASIRAGEEIVGNSASLTSRPEDSYEMLQAAVGVQKVGGRKEPPLKGKIIR